MCAAGIRHPRVPCPQVPNHDVPAPRLGLARWADGSPLREGLLGDPGDGLAGAIQLVGVDPAPAPAAAATVTRRRLLVAEGRLRVGPEPELGGAVVCGEVAEGYVGDEVVGAQRVVEGRVLVYGLAEARGVRRGGVGCEPVPDGFGA